jgi:CRISPR system Cascade subunit CasE
MAHVTAEYQRSWLTKKAPGCGFILEEGQFDVVETEQLRFWRKSDKPPVTIGVAVFEGVLQISDEALFKAALTNGFGRAKAYGCGLLTLANYNE